MHAKMLAVINQKQKLKMKVVPKYLKVILLLQLIILMKFFKKQSIKKNTSFRLICQPR